MSKKSSLSNFLWNLIGTGFNSVMSFIFVILVTRLNGLESSGMFSVCLSVSFILYAVSNLGNRVYEVADSENSDNLYFTVKILSCALALAAAVILCVAFGYGGVKFAVVMLLMAARCIESFSDTVYAVFQKNDRLDLVGISYTLKNLLVLAVFIAVDIITGNVLVAAATVPASTAAVFFAFDILLSRRFGGIRFVSFKGTKGLIKGISYFFFFNLVMIIISNIPRLIADTRYGSEQMGFFATVMMIPTVMMLLGQFIIQPFLTRLIALFEGRDLKRFNKTAFFILSVLAVCGAVGSAAAYFIGPPVLGLIMGVDLKSLAAAMAIAIAAGSFNVFTTLISSLLTVMKRTAKQLLFYIITLVAEVAFVYVAVLTDNLTNVFWAYLLAMAVQFSLFLVYYLVSLKAEQASHSKIALL